MNIVYKLLWYTIGLVDLNVMFSVLFNITIHYLNNIWSEPYSNCLGICLMCSQFENACNQWVIDF